MSLIVADIAIVTVFVLAVVFIIPRNTATPEDHRRGIALNNHANFLKRMHYLDRARLEYCVLEAFASIYEETGMVFHSLSEFEQTSYYPFKESYGISNVKIWDNAYQGHLDVKVQQLSDSIEYTAILLENGKVKSLASKKVSRIPSETITERRKKLYSSGISAITDYFMSYRNYFSKEGLSCMDSTFSRQYFHPKPLPHCISLNDIPKDQAQMKSYTDWLLKLWHTEKLLDGDDKQFIFSLNNSGLLITSKHN